jgi:predicted transcriptional regulator
MIKEMQKRFYLEVGKRLTTARHSRNMTVGQLSRLVGEQNKTIRQIERGNVCSLHHIAWMKEVFDLNLDGILSMSMEGDSDKGEEGTIDDLI